MGDGIHIGVEMLLSGMLFETALHVDNLKNFRNAIHAASVPRKRIINHHLFTLFRSRVESLNMILQQMCLVLYLQKVF